MASLQDSIDRTRTCTLNRCGEAALEAYAASCCCELLCQIDMGARKFICHAALQRGRMRRVMRRVAKPAIGARAHSTSQGNSVTRTHQKWLVIPREGPPVTPARRYAGLPVFSAAVRAVDLLRGVGKLGKSS